MEITKRMALIYAKEFNLEHEVEESIKGGDTPADALREWDCYPELKPIYFGIDTDPFQCERKYDFKKWLEERLGRECPWASCFFGCAEWDNVLVTKKQHEDIVKELKLYYENGSCRGAQFKKLDIWG